MMTEGEYLYAWLFYLAGALILVGCWWYLIRKLPWTWLKYTSILLLTVTFTVPWFSDTNEIYLAPALIVSLVELLFEGKDAFWRAGLPLVMAMVLSLLLSIITYFIYWYFTRDRRGREYREEDIPESISEIHLDRPLHRDDSSTRSEFRY